MPTIICLDVSLSMEQRSADMSLLNHALSSLKTFLQHLQAVDIQDFIEIITFSNSASVLVEFSRNYNTLISSLGEVESEDRTDIRELVSLCLKETQQWNLLTPTHIILVTDKIPAPLPEGDLEGGFPAGCTMSLVALTPTTDVNNKTKTFLSSCKLQGKLYPGPVLSKESIDRVFESILLDNYTKCETTLCFGHQSTPVTLSPSVDPAHLTATTSHPFTTPASLKIHGFLPATDLHNPPYISRHIVVSGAAKAPAKVAAKTPDLRIMLNEVLRAKDCVAVVDLGLGWFGVLSSHLPKQERNLKKSNLVFSIVAPNSFSWLGNMNFLGLKRLVSTDKQTNMPFRAEYSNSYDNKSGSGMVWVKSSTLKQSIMKVIRYAKRLPDKGSAMFLKELNKVRKSILYYGFTDMMGVLCELLEKEKNEENSEILESCIGQLKNEADPTKVIK